MSNKIINKLISILNNQDLDALALVPGSNFRYVTGGNFHLMERPTLFIVSKTYKPIAILHVLEVESFTKLNMEADIGEWQDSDGYQLAFDISFYLINFCKIVITRCICFFGPIVILKYFSYLEIGKPFEIIIP